MVTSFNVVLVGENFPVASLRADDFTFRHKKFRETLRLGPTFQAQCGDNVAISALPDRFQIEVNKADDLPIQSAGVSEILEVLMTYVGRRTLKAMGRNAAVRLNAPVPDILNQEFVESWLGDTVPGGSTVLLTMPREQGDNVQVALGYDEQKFPVLNLNFHTDLSSSERLDTSAEFILAGLREAESLHEKLLGLVEAGAAS